MKIRNGYVSNSSSSSFCILGVELPGYSEISGNVGNLTRDRYDEIKDGAFDGDLTMYSGIADYSEESTFIGKYPSSMKDDETLLEFKERILKEINSIGFEFTINDIAWYVDGGYDN